MARIGRDPFFHFHDYGRKGKKLKNAFEFQGGRAVIEGVQKNLKLTDRQIRPLLGFNFDGKSLSFSIFSAQKRQDK